MADICGTVVRNSQGQDDFVLPHRTNQQLGERIAALRKERSVPQRALAEVLDLDPSALSRIESGDRGLGAGELLVIAQFFDVTTDALLRTDHEEPFASYLNKGDEEIERAVTEMRTVIANDRMLATVAGSR